VGETYSTHAGCEKFTEILIRTPEGNRYTWQGIIKTEQKYENNGLVVEKLLALDTVCLLVLVHTNVLEKKKQVTITI
jgi:hypothetical protein